MSGNTRQSVQSSWPSVEGSAFDEHGWLLTLEGECDLNIAPCLRDCIARGVTQGHRHLVVDLSAATLIDCATVGALLAALEPLRGDDRASVALVAADGVVTRVLTLLRLDRLFDVFADRAAAERHVTRVKRFRHEGWRDVQLLGAHVAASPS